MSNLYYMGLADGPRWTRVLTDVGAQLKPYEKYLDTAIKAAERHRPVLAWREPTVAERKEFDARLRARIEERNEAAQEAPKRRDQYQRTIPAGTWIVLEPPPWNGEESESTFEQFLAASEFHDSPEPRPSTVLERMAWDIEGRALLLNHPPKPLTPERGREHLRSTRTEPHGPLLWIRADTYGLDRQRRALHTLDNFPIATFRPLISLLHTQARWPRCEPMRLADEDWCFLRPEHADEPLRDGTIEQRRFVEIALATPDFAVLEGPPGSGKTTAICELIIQLARQGLRTLLVASTNVAVDNVLERLIEWQHDLPEHERMVLPVRIGKPERLSSEKIEPFLHETLARTVCDDILDFFDEGGGSSTGAAARELLRERLVQEDSRESIIHRLVYENVNLVCGTPIGVLAHPEIRERREIGPKVLFDVLIVDEASKTTFSEFLVPAIYAAKWVIVGDIKQLSPYVEGEDIAENLRRDLCDLDIETPAFAAVRAFEAAVEGRVARSLVGCDEHEALLLQEEAQWRRVPFVNLDDCQARTVAGINDVVPELLAPNLVFGRPETIAAFEHRLPETLELFDGPLPPLPDYQAAHAHYRRDEPEPPKDWAGEYGWRLVRSYELRQNPVEREKLERELEGLLPTTIDAPVRERLVRRTFGVRRVALPSILELIQTGFERLPNWDKGTAINDGLPASILAERMVSLSYQHRMHPDISAFSREQFYSEDNTGAETLLRDARTTNREWSYPRYRRRALWINIRRPRDQRGNRNEAEADVVLHELAEFLEWARGPGRRAEPWRVAVLTFYRGQEALLRERIRRLTGQRGNTRNFAVPRERPEVEITLCTVDRFQGHEADLVLLSFVKGRGRSRSVGFLNSPNRLNVALTRARYQMVLIGDCSFFVGSNSQLLRTLAQSDHYRADIAWGGER